MAPRPYSFQGRANPKPSPKPRKPRTPRKPTKAEQWTAKARVIQQTSPRAAPPSPKPVYGPPKPVRKPRPLTRAEKVTAKARDRTRKIEAKTEPRAPKATGRIGPAPVTDRERAAVDRFKRGPTYAEALAAAGLSKDIQGRLKTAREAPAHTPKKLGIPVGRTVKAKDLIPERGTREPKAPKGAVRFDEPVSTKGKTLGELAELDRVLKRSKPENVVEHVSEWSRETAKDKRRQQQMSTGSSKAAGKVLDYTIRPTYAVAGAGGAVIHGKNPVKAAARGFTGKDKRLWSRNLRDLGVPKSIAGPAGLVLDIGTDPTTYVTLGAGNVARRSAMQSAARARRAVVKTETTQRAAREAAEKAAAEAAERGATPKQAAKVHKRTEKATTRQIATERGRAAEAASLRGQQRTGRARHRTKGVTINFAGKRVPLVTAATSGGVHALKVGGRKVVPRVVREGAGKTGRAIVRQVHPRTRPHGVTEAEHVAGREIVARAQAHVTHGDQRSTILAQALRHVPADQHAAFIKALETKRLTPLADNAAEVLADKRRVARGGGRPRVTPQGDLFKHAIQTRAKLDQAFTQGRRAGAIKGKVGDTREYLTKADLAALEKTAVSEAKGQARRYERVKHGVSREEGRRAVAEEAAKGSAGRVAAVQTERARGQSKAQAQREQHAAQVEFERAHAGARVSAATTKTSPALKQRHRDFSAATREHGKARTALRQAQARLRAEQAKPVTRRRGVASLDARVTDAQRRVTGAQQSVKGARAGIQAERARISGVAPAQHETLLGALERRGERAAPAPVARVTPKPPAGARLTRAEARVTERTRELAAARERAEAARALPQRGARESHEQYLTRLVEHADRHGLDLVKRRAEKLLAAKPKHTAKGYFPRDFDSRILEQLGIKPRDLQPGAQLSPGTRGKVSRITSGYKRANQERLDVANPKREAAGQEQFSTDVPLVVANHLRRVNRATSEGEMLRELAALGRPVRSADELKPGEQLYRLGQDGGQFGLTPAKNVPARVSQAPGAGLPDKFSTKPRRPAQYVALNPALVREVTAAGAPITKTRPGELFDAATGAFKRTAIASAAFHIRNAIGDIQQAYYQIPGHKLPGAMVQGARAANRAREQAGQVQAPATTKTIPVAGDAMPMDEFLAGARRNGVTDAGWFGRELDQMSRPGHERIGKIRGGPIARGKQALDRWMTARENIMRLGSYKVGLDNGLTEPQAAAFANKLHIDYGDLSELERVVLRRAMPFYTWTARSLPLAAETLITRPGKFANLEKIRQEVGNTYSDLSHEERNERMTEAVMRQLPAVVKIGGENVALSASLPATLLNELPSGISKDAAGEWRKELARLGWGMTNPLIKAPFELGANRVLVTKADIEDPKRPLTAAPSWVKHLPDVVKDKLKVTEGYKDPRTGNTTMGWRGNADWTYDQLMLGWYGQAAAIAGAGRTPGAEKKSTIPSALGLRVDPLNANLAKRAAEKPLRDERTKINSRLGALRQTGISLEAGNATAEYKRLNARLSEITKRLHPEKATKKKKSGFGAGGGFSGGGGFNAPGKGFGGGKGF